MTTTAPPVNATDAFDTSPRVEPFQFDARLIVSLQALAQTRRTLREMRTETPVPRAFHAIDWIYDIVRELRRPRPE